VLSAFNSEKEFSEEGSADTKHRDMMRMYRKARKLAYEIRGPWKKPEKAAKREKRVYRA
jgi:hypothetical protein